MSDYKSQICNLQLESLETPCYVVDRVLLERNLKILADVQERTGCRILLALKAFSMFSVAPLVKQYLKGTSASGLNEARLGREEFGGEVHVCGTGYSDAEFQELLEIADHITFNSFGQWHRRKALVQAHDRSISCGIRLNPEYSEVKTAIYNPCGKGSRLGVTAAEFRADELDGIDGLHFHALCELNSDSLENTLEVVEAKFGGSIDRMEWVNFGGGHHVTREDYDIERLVRIVRDFSRRHKDVMIYLEPGEAIALNAGVFVSEVLDITRNELDIAILDMSATAHMPDVLEMPYRPEVIGAEVAGVHQYTYRLGCASCLAGDVIGDYSFERPLEVGDRLVFADMAVYTMVKNNTFNGMSLPSIYLHDPDAGNTQLIKSFSYDDFKMRLS